MALSSDSPNVFEDVSAIRRLGVLCERSEGFKQWVFDQLQYHQCHRILDAACGTGGDSLLLLKKGFQVVGSDGAEAMVRIARRVREEQHIENWDIQKANWLTLKEDLHGYGEFDAVLCLSSSIICLVDPSSNQDLYRRSFENFKSMLKPGGILLIDHRNMDAIIDHGEPVNKNIYFKENTIAKMTSEILQCPKTADVINITYYMKQGCCNHTSNQGKQIPNGDDFSSGNEIIEKVMVPVQPIRAEKFTSILAEVFGKDCFHAHYADFMPIERVSEPAYYQHVVVKKK